MNINRKYFWDEQHRINSLESLSGSQFDSIMEGLMIKNWIICRNLKILEVGVGMGYVTEALTKMGEVSALDISPIGLDRVKPFCKYTYDLEQMEKMQKDYYNLIICANLIQHIPTSFLETELRQLIRVLNPEGLFSMQFVSKKGIHDDGNVEYTEGVSNYYRSVDWMGDLINKLGGVWELVKDKQIDGCNIMHIRKEAS